MSREEREALLETETPDLPDPPSPVQAGARRLVGIVIVSLIISAAVSVSLILTLTAGLQERVKRDVLAALEGEKDAAKAELPKQAVLVYVPERCREPLSSEMAVQATNAQRTVVLEKVVADEKVQDTAWYAANAQRPVDALREALQVTGVPGERFLAFHSDAIPAADRELILRRCAEAYVTSAAKVGQMPLQNRLGKALLSRENLAKELDAAEDEFVALSESGKVQLDLPALQRRAWQAAADRPETVAAAKLLAELRVEALANQQFANQRDAVKVSLQADRCGRLRDRLIDLDAEIALLKVQLAERVDPMVPRVCEAMGLVTVPKDVSAIETLVVEAPVRAELDVLQRQIATRREEGKALTDRVLKLVQILGAAPAALRDEVRQAIREQVELELTQEALRRQVDAITQPASRPATQPAEDEVARRKEDLAGLAKRIDAARTQVDKAVREFQDRWKLQRDATRIRTAVNGMMHAVDALERRKAAIELDLATPVVGKVVWEKD